MSAFAERTGLEPSGPFNLLGEGLQIVNGKIRLRPEQRRFRKEALELYGRRCAVCELACEEALDAAHLCPTGKTHLCPTGKKGSYDVRNGIVLCASPHRLFDHGLFVIVPDKLTVELHPKVVSHAHIGITQLSLIHLLATPHPTALQWRYDDWQKRYS